MINKHELVNATIEKVYATLNKDVRPFVYVYELEHILLDALEGYELLDIRKLKDNLHIVKRPMSQLDPLRNTHERFETGMYLSFLADKRELDRFSEAKEYFEDYMKNAFISNLDELSSTKDSDAAMSDYFRLMRLLKDRGIETYEKAVAYFARKDAEDRRRMNDALDEYYNGPKHRDEREFY